MTLLCRVGARQQWTGLAQAEVELPEQALALPNAKLDSVRFLDPRRQRLAIPQVDLHSGIARLWHAALDSFLGPVCHPVDVAAPVGHLRSGRPSPHARTGEPNTRQNEVRRRAVWQPPGTSCPGRPKALHAADDRTATLPSAESLAANQEPKQHPKSVVVS
jgi:hypothetical protein